MSPILSSDRHGLDSVDLTAHRKRDHGAKHRSDIEAEIARLQIQMLCVQQAYFTQGRRAVILFEGWDAAGKGGAIRRLTEGLDHRAVKIWPIGPPHDGEQGVHYLYRFWERLPPAGTLAIFDRSWYGRVLVERVDKLTRPEAWRRAYDEINGFEKLLTDDGVPVIKIFLHISAAEQRRRLEDRLATPYKRWKLTVDDFHNRAKRKQYMRAMNEMLDRTWTTTAPWHVLSGESKLRARLEVLRIVVKRLSDGVDVGPLPLSPELRAVAKRVFGALPPGV